MSSVSGLVLASGSSTRFGAENKLLAPLATVPMIVRTVQAYVDAALDEVVVVVGHDAPQVEALLAALPVRCVLNPDFAQGQSKALVQGIAALDKRAGAAVIGVADQPLLTGEIVRALVQASASSGDSIVVPRYAGQPGNPVVFGATYFTHLRAVTGDAGGRSVIEQFRDRVCWLDVDDDGPSRDVDTLHDLAWVVDRLTSNPHADAS